MAASPTKTKYNAAGSLLAAATNAISLFLLFRMGYRYLGPDVLGLWALLQGIMLIPRISDIGSGNNITRLIAIERAKSRGVRIARFIGAGFAVSTLPVICIGIAVSIPAYFYVRAHYNAPHITPHIVLLLVADSLLFGVLNSLGSLLAGCLDGLGLMAVRGILASISNISLIAAGFIFIPKMGDAGLGAAYVAYGVCLIALMGVGTCFSSTRYRSTAPVPSMRAIITSSLSFNVQLLAIGFFRLLLDPVSKLLIGTFSGLDLIATFDLASKVTTQVRVMFSSAAQAILPMASRELHGLDGSLQKALRSWNTRISKWSLYVSAGSVMGSGILSMIAFGHVNERFILYFGLLSLANSINTFGLVGYYVDLGSANLAGLLRIHAVMGGENVLLGVLLGWMFGGTGVVVAASIALIHSGLACLSLWLKHENESLVDSLSGLKFEGVVFGVGSAYAYFLIPHISAIGSSAAVCVGLVVLGFLFIWREGNWVMRRRNLAHNDVI